jgi:hypothetical protein
MIFLFNDIESMKAYKFFNYQKYKLLNVLFNKLRFKN